MYNTFEEHAAAVFLSQRERLGKTKQGRTVLNRLGYAPRPFYSTDDTSLLDREIRARICVAPIPKNMSPKYHGGRREARVRALRRSFEGKPDVYYTDASYSGCGIHIAVATCQERVVGASVKTACTATAEATAVALALKDAECRGTSAAVITDSQAACRLFLSGAVPRAVIRIIGNKLCNFHSLTWCPAHEGMEGNTRVDRLARVLNIRAADQPRRDFPTTARDILEQQREERREFGRPHPKLTRRQAMDWRRLQTNTYPNLHKLRQIHGEAYADKCPWCGEKPTLPHITHMREKTSTSEHTQIY